jgi:hypothetical protein
MVASGADPAWASLIWDGTGTGGPIDVGMPGRLSRPAPAAELNTRKRSSNGCRRQETAAVVRAYHIFLLLLRQYRYSMNSYCTVSSTGAHGRKYSLRKKPFRIRNLVVLPSAEQQKGRPHARPSINI